MTNDHQKRRTRVAAFALGTMAAAAMAFAPLAAAESLGPITFEAPTYSTAANINGQHGWMKTGGYDVAVSATSGFPAAAGYGFGSQALRISNSVTSSSFGDQTFSPGLQAMAGEAATSHYEASFKIGSTQATQQTGLFVSVSPDDGNGSRMSYLGFEDQADGIHVIFFDVDDPGPLGTVAEFEESDIGTLSRSASHSIKFSIDFKAGPGNDVVQIFIDGALAHTGTTWEDYYRYDPEQAGNNNRVPLINRLLFRAGGTAVGGNAGKGYLIDGLALNTEGAAGPTGATGATGVAGNAGAAGAEGKSGSTASVALKRKMAITFPKETVALNGSKADVVVRCAGSTAQRCVGTLALKMRGTVQRAVYSVQRGQTATVSVPLVARAQEAAGSGIVVRAVARTEQTSGRPFRTSRKLNLK